MLLLLLLPIVSVVKQNTFGDVDEVDKNVLCTHRHSVAF